MANLYSDLATVYEAMYQTFINYHDEYVFYSDILKQYGKRSLLEIGSGTGNLARHFLNNGFEYTGLDYSEDMISLAKTKIPEGKFMRGDMRDFSLTRPVQSALITGRTISYLLTNENVNATFSSIHKNLAEGGILCFDFIDANPFIPSIAGGKRIIHEAFFKDTHYLRESQWTINLETGMDFKWDSTYFTKQNEQLTKIGEDHSIIRTFTLNEMEIFLSLNNFNIKACIERPSYAFPTLVIIAERING